MKYITSVLLGFCLIVISGCVEPSARTAQTRVQSSIQDQANAMFPTPIVNNFLMREAVVKQTKRMDEKGKLFYLYLLGDNGQQIGYYVSNTRPIPTCSYLTPPQNVSSGDGKVVLTAPGLGGTYPGTCDSIFFFDSATDAYVEVSGFKYFISDQPLQVNAEPIEVKAQ